MVFRLSSLHKAVETTVVYNLEGPFALGHTMYDFSPMIAMNEVINVFDKGVLLTWILLKYADDANRIPSLSQQFVQTQP